MSNTGHSLVRRNQEMLEAMESDDRANRARAIKWWTHKEPSSVIEILLPLLFRGRDNLDSSAVQVLVRLGSDAVRRVVELAFDRLPTLRCTEESLSHSINSLTKYTAQAAVDALPKYLEVVERQQDPISLRILIRFLENLAKLPRSTLKALDLSGLLQLLHAFRNDSTKWLPGQFYILRSSATQVLERAGIDCFFGDHLVEILLRRMMSNQEQVLAPALPSHWRKAFFQLVDSYRTIGSRTEATEWYRWYSVTVFSMLIEHPTGLTGDWRRTAIQITKPGLPEGEELAWRLVRDHGIVDPSGQMKPASSLGLQVFHHLLLSGNIAAVSVLRRLVDQGITPTRQWCESLHILMASLGGASFYDEVNRTVMALGNHWEELCRRIARVRYGSILVHPKLTNGKVPDIVPTDDVTWAGNRIARAPLIIEVKKSDSSASTRIVEKYRGYCDALEVWTLAPTPGKRIVEAGTTVVYASELAQMVQPLAKELAYDIMALLGQLEGPDLEASIFAEAARAQGVPDDSIEKVVSLFTQLLPYFTEFRVKRWLEPAHNR